LKPPNRQSCYDSQNTEIENDDKIIPQTPHPKTANDRDISQVEKTKTLFFRRKRPAQTPEKAH
jgi:hypothetical protein